MKLLVPSASVVGPGVQVSVLVSVAAVGVKLTLASTGAVLAMVTLLEAAVPKSVPSSGVTVQVTTSLPTNAPESVLPVPTTTPSRVHA